MCLYLTSDADGGDHSYHMMGPKTKIWARIGSHMRMQLSTDTSEILWVSNVENEAG
jgi:hypothetical protein